MTDTTKAEELRDLFEQARAETARDRDNKIRAQIRVKLNEQTAAELQVEQCRHQLTKAEAKLEQINRTIARLAEGDWSALPKDDKPKQGKDNADDPS